MSHRRRSSVSAALRATASFPRLARRAGLTLAIVAAACARQPPEALVVRPDPAPLPMIVTPFPAPGTPAPSVQVRAAARPMPVVFVDDVRIPAAERESWRRLDPDVIARIVLVSGPAAAQRFADDPEAQSSGAMLIYTKAGAARP